MSINILAADTGTRINTVAVWRDGAALAESVADCHRAHSERLLETTRAVMREAGIELADVDALAIAVGPGSFTGLRIGVSAWKGLALGANLPLVGVSSLEALAQPFRGLSRPVCALLPARLEEVFAAVYPSERGACAMLEPVAAPLNEVLRETPPGAVYTGEGAHQHRNAIERLDPAAIFAPRLLASPRASAVADVANALLEAGVCSDPAAVRPLYLRKAQAERLREQAAP